MKMTRTPGWLMQLYPRRLWRMPADQPVVYLTFDDGPTPGVTDRLLDLLAEHKAKATFFCVGDRVRRHPALVQRMIREGHTPANHTQHHLNGWKTSTADYLADVELADQSLAEVLGQTPGLFRPPYGKIGRKSAQIVARSHQLVMWDVMPGDFYPDHDAETVGRLVMENSQAGSVIVLHDSPKYGEKMLAAMPGILHHFAKKGYRMEAIPDPKVIPQTQI